MLSGRPRCWLSDNSLEMAAPTATDPTDRRVNEMRLKPLECFAETHLEDVERRVLVIGADVNLYEHRLTVVGPQSAHQVLDATVWRLPVRLNNRPATERFQNVPKRLISYFTNLFCMWPTTKAPADERRGS
jgi:hypothetical protein